MATVSVGADWSYARPAKSQLDKYGIQFACRYLLDDARNRGKALKRPEALRLSSWGRTIVGNFEYATQPNLTFAQGTADARVSLAELVAIGAPRRVVYFSFDYDVPLAHFPGVLTYLRGAGSVLGMENVGAYGHFRLVEYLGGQGIRWLWQCYAWSAGRWSGYATVRQVRNNAFPGDFEGDLDYAQAEDIGQWSLTQEADMDMNTPTPSGAPTYGMRYGDAIKALVRGANAATAAAAGVLRLEADDAAHDLKDTQQHAELTAQLTQVIELLDAMQTGDPAELADALADKLGDRLDQPLIDALRARIAS
jgi:hypothetical protein